MNPTINPNQQDKVEACVQDLIAAGPEVRALVLKTLWKEQPNMVREHLPTWASVLELVA